ncbi:MAG: hypothetical protein RMN52_00845 [Anaerolineae bacterium]|nr:hypothetical protein [Candidatus Roseilinea sp.]MDW8448524.1 hypothetical protein [Anaerolineae bacterium]
MQVSIPAPAREPRSSSFQVRLAWLEDCPSITVNTDATTVRRRVSAWLFDHVATMLMGDAPQLTLEREGGRVRALWRVPVVLTSRHGILGNVGEVVVDANTGEPAVSDALANALIAQAQSLLAANASSVGSSPPST